jgi:hypothetical protein
VIGRGEALSWPEFVSARADLAKDALPLYLLAEGKAGLGYLATVRSDGGPRVHPISPVLLDGRLYAFVLRRTSKCADLHRDGRYALHSWPKPFEEDRFDDEEFYMAGTASVVEDESLRQRVAKACGDEVSTGDVFELSVSNAMHKQRVGGLRYTTWASSAVGEPA